MTLSGTSANSWLTARAMLWAGGCDVGDAVSHAAHAFEVTGKCFVNDVWYPSTTKPEEIAGDIEKYL
eukprot:scaffold28946_cov18-Tisochrysis_lutea.AAC.1